LLIPESKNKTELEMIRFNFSLFPNYLSGVMHFHGDYSPVLIDNLYNMKTEEDWTDMTMVLMPMKPKD